MMATYFWDLGFDINAVQQGDGTSYLQHGFNNGNGPAIPVSLNAGDTIQFNAFDVTNTNGQTSSFSITGGSIQFSNAEVNQLANSYPFNGTTASLGNNTQETVDIDPTAGTATIPISSFGQSTQQATSVFFSGPVRVVQFPMWNITSSSSPLQIANNGRFLMKVTLTVQETGGSPRSFVVDPEMVVGSIG
jgi:hypothetical protein